MPNNFALAQTVILRSGISVSGLAVCERESKKARSAVSQPRREREADEKSQNSAFKTKSIEYLTILRVFV